VAAYPLPSLQVGIPFHITSTDIKYLLHAQSSNYIITMTFSNNRYSVLQAGPLHCGHFHFIEHISVELCDAQRPQHSQLMIGWLLHDMNGKNNTNTDVGWG
jgi:hypothetical protein